MTEDAAEKARAIIKAKLRGNTLNSGIDPELLRSLARSARSRGADLIMGLPVRDAAGRRTEVLFNATAYRNALGRVSGLPYEAVQRILYAKYRGEGMDPMEAAAEVSPVQVLGDCWARIEAVNPRHNALVALRRLRLLSRSEEAASGSPTVTSSTNWAASSRPWMPAAMRALPACSAATP